MGQSSTTWGPQTNQQPQVSLPEEAFPSLPGEAHTTGSGLPQLWFSPLAENPQISELGRRLQGMGLCDGTLRSDSMNFPG